MAYDPNNTFIIDLKLTEDLSGSLYEPYVISVEHVVSGVLNVLNGGLGSSSIPYGSIIVGNNSDVPVFLTGSSNDILMWSQESSSWIAKNIDIVESIDITSDQNNIFSIEDISVGEEKKFNITFLTQSYGLFLASPSASNGSLILRRIQKEDLPSIFENITVIDSEFSGTFTGSVLATKLIADGSQLYNISSSQIIDFEERVTDIATSLPNIYSNIYAQTASFVNANIENANISGSFIGDGSGIVGIVTTNIVNFSDEVRGQFSAGSGILIESGNISAPLASLEIVSGDTNINISSSLTERIVTLSSSVTLSNLTASNASINSLTTNILNINNLNSQIISSSYITGNMYGSFFGSYSGSGNLISSIPNSSLVNDSIFINGNAIKLGESVQVSGISSVSSSNPNIITNLSGSVVEIGLQNNLSIPYVSSQYLSSSEIYGGKYYGDGSSLTNINLSDPQILRSLLLVEQYNIVTSSDGEIRLNRNIDVDIVTSSIVRSTNIICNDTVYSDLVSSSNFYGNGFNIYNIDAKKIVNPNDIFESLVFVGGNNIQTQTDISGTTVVDLNNDISVTTVTASFSGDGKNITNLTSPRYKIVNGSGFSIGDVVCYTTSGLNKADYRYDSTNNPIGIISNISGNFLSVQLDGEIYIDNLNSSSLSGKIFYLGPTGSVLQYGSINSGNFAVKVGTCTESGKLMIDFKKLWKVK